MTSRHGSEDGKKSDRTSAKRDGRALTIGRMPDETDERAIARAALRPSVQAAATVQEYDKGLFENLELGSLINELSAQAEAASSGDLKRSEAMLIAQAHTLDAIFNNLARRAIRSEYMSQLEPFLRLGLKAQSQCRATLETLALLKNPPNVAFVRQANIAHGAQQINNGAAQSGQVSRAGEPENTQSKLLEDQYGERLDTGTACTASRTDPQLEAMGAIDGTEITRR